MSFFNRNLEPFEEVWRSGSPPQIDEYLEHVSASRTHELLQELILIDMKYRWWFMSEEREGQRQSGDHVAGLPLRPRVEDYVAAFPQLGSSESWAAPLILIEYTARWKWGDRPDLDEYQDRFPWLIETPEWERLQEHSETKLEPGSRSGSASEQHAGSATPGTDESEIPTLRFGRYQIRDCLGEGSFGKVYQALDTQLKRMVAIKVAREGLTLTPQEKKRFIKEAQTVAGLNYSGIVPVYDVGQSTDGRFFIVSRWIDGVDLNRYLKDNHLSRFDAVRIIQAVAEALHQTHIHGLIHRDIKPENILLDHSGKAFVADFGLALHEDEQHSHSGEVSGSPAYMAPEQIQGNTQYLDGRADIWSLGVILYRLLTGRLPFRGEGIRKLFDEIEKREPKPLRMIDDSICPELETITLKCLVKDVRDRYATAADLARDLNNWLAGSTGPTTGSAIVPAGGRFRRSLTTGAGICFLAISVLVTINSLQSNTPSPPEDSSSSPARLPPATNASVGSTIPLDQASDRIEPVSELEGNLDVCVWNREKPERRGRSIRADGVLPLQAGDQIRIEAILNRRANIYLLWVGSDGDVQPVYPWRPGEWESRPGTEMKVQRISLPEQVDQGWPLSGPGGMESLVLLARDTPLPADTDLASRLSGFPAQPCQSERMVVWFESGQPMQNATRAPNFSNPQQLEDPVLRTQAELQRRLSDKFVLIQSVCFSNAGSH